jgi:mannan endo-1,4-beta-mannosidase
MAEAKKRGIYLILSLVNNWSAFGGKGQYVQWARDQGHYLGSDEDFFTDGLTQRFYMNHIEVCSSMHTHALTHTCLIA